MVQATPKRQGYAEASKLRSAKTALFLQLGSKRTDKQRIQDLWNTEDAD